MSDAQNIDWPHDCVTKCAGCGLIMQTWNARSGDPERLPPTAKLLCCECDVRTMTESVRETYGDEAAADYERWRG